MSSKNSMLLISHSQEPSDVDGDVSDEKMVEVGLGVVGVHVDVGLGNEVQYLFHHLRRVDRV